MVAELCCLVERSVLERGGVLVCSGWLRDTRSARTLDADDQCWNRGGAVVCSCLLRDTRSARTLDDDTCDGSLEEA